MDTKIVGGTAAAAVLGAAIAIHVAAPAGHTGSGTLIEPVEAARPPAIAHVGAGALIEPIEAARPPRHP